MMNLNLAVLFVFFSITIINLSQAELTDVVQTKYGPVQGDILTTVVGKLKYSSFKGIPYAQPPVGQNRFQPPRNPDPWTETLYAQKDANQCPQLDKSKQLVGDEDCLYLNVYSPELELSAPEELKTVMVWIHGGAFLQGSSNSALYGPDFIVEKDVVLVAMNYRLAALGFLTLGNEMISGNAGLKDQALAIKWVSENIEKFGGDPNKITIFGESAGSVSVEYHHLSTLSRGLFRASISMSGSPLNPWAFNELETAKKRTIERIQSKILSTFDSDSTEDIAKLYDVSFDKFVHLDNFIFTDTDDFFFAFMPTKEVEGTQNQPFITNEPLSIYESGDFYHVPHILGYMNEEAIAFLGLTYPLSYGDNRTAIAILTSHVFRQGINQTRQFMIDNGPDSIFYYRTVFDYPESLHKVNGVNVNGSAHADDLPYLFYLQDRNQPLDPNDEVSIFRDKYVTLFTNFAKNLDPSAVFDDGTNIQWPPTDSAGLLLKMDSTFEVLARDD